MGGTRYENAAITLECTPPAERALHSTLTHTIRKHRHNECDTYKKIERVAIKECSNKILYTATSSSVTHHRWSSHIGLETSCNAAALLDDGPTRSTSTSVRLW